MVDKFPNFDVYQLGKYNKERTIKRKQKKMRELGMNKPDKPMLTMKQMIRQLHLSKPVYNVMCLLGKKYPVAESDFRLSGLSGQFEIERAGRRMKLPTPETWETLLSAKGNKASAWEELIEHKKLPFMAMLRNLRNLIYTGVNPKYHKWAQNRLSNERAVAQSRQFPFRFFSAYEVIPADLDTFKQLVSGQDKPGAPADKKRKKKKPIIPAMMPPPNVFADYRKALDTAVKLATIHNVDPIRGSTVVFCNTSEASKVQCNGAKGMGNSVRSIQEVGYLLGLMCKYVCEECDFRLFSSPSGLHKNCHVGVDLIEGTILDNMKIVAQKAAELGGGNEFPYDYLEEAILKKKRIDNLLVLSFKVISASEDENRLANLLTKYRQEVNPELLFVSVDLSGSGRAMVADDEANPNNIAITGFSEQILRFIAERGDNNQLNYVEHIDEAAGLKEDENNNAPQEAEVSPWWRWLESIYEKEGQKQTFPNITVGSQWREARVFISSTFLDMHGERDYLTRIVFPELKERCKKRKINLVEVDLRWGVTEEESQLGKSIQLCLDEVERCRPFFVGMLGDRYGWAPAQYEVPQHERFSWLNNYPAGRSITELEMYSAGLNNPEVAKQQGGTFFYIRDPNSLNEVPKEQKKYFEAGDVTAKSKMDNLKKTIKDSGLPVFDYPAKWHGIVDGKPMIGGLEKFGERVFNDLWGAICKHFPEEESHKEDLHVERSFHQALVEEKARKFIGRKDLLDSMKKFANGNKGKLMVVSGKPGEGKTALVSAFAKKYAEENPDVFVLPHFVNASPESNDIRKTLRRLCLELKHAFALDVHVPEDFKELTQQFPILLEQASFKGRLVVVIDALNQLNDKVHRAQGLDWLPEELPCKFIVSATVETKPYEILKKRTALKMSELKLTPLSVAERTELVREILWEYHKKLDERPMNNQMRVLLRKAEATKPLYLVVACEELRVFGVYEQISERIKNLGATVPKLFDEVLQRLEGDHGKEFVKTALTLILCSRGGLMENEMVDLLQVYNKTNNLDSSPEAVRQHWNRLYRSLGYYLKPSGDSTNGETTLNFFHEQMAIAVKKRYLSIAKSEIKIHEKIAQHFYSRADPKTDGTWLGATDQRAIRELPYHLTAGKMWKQLQKVLCDMSYIEIKCSYEMTFDLIADYNLACAEDTEEFAGKQEIREFMNFVKSSAHVLSKNPSLSFQQAANQPDHTAPAKEAQRLWNKIKTASSDQQVVQSWVKWLNKPQEKDACKMTFNGFGEGVTATAFSPDGKYLACAAKDNVVRLFNAQTGLEIASFSGHSNWIASLAFAPDGRQIVSASWDKTLKVWDLYLGRESMTLSGHDRRVNDACFSNDGKWILSASWDCSMILWNTSDGSIKRSYKGHSKPVNSCSFSPDNTKVISGSWDGTIKIFDMETGTCESTLKAHNKSVTSVAYSPTGKQVVSGSLDKSLIIWDPAAAKPITVLPSHTKPINSVGFSNDGQHVISASDDCTLRVWSSNLGKEKNVIKVKAGHMLCVAFHPQNNLRLVTGSSECTLHIWDLENNEEIVTMKGHTRAINHCEYSPDGKYIASASDDASIMLWDAQTGELVRKFTGHRDCVAQISFSPVAGDTRLVSCSDDFSLRVWNYMTGEMLTELTGHDSVVRACSFAPNGKLIASASRDNSLRVWDSRNGKCLQTLRAHKDWLNCCHFSPDGNRIVTSSWDYNMKLWHVRKGEDIATMSGHSSAVVFCRFSPDGTKIISASYDGTLKIWDSQSASEITTLAGHTQRVNMFTYSGDGKFLASVSDDGTIKIWDPLAATEVAALIGHSQSVRKTKFSPVNNQITSASDDGSVKIWEPAMGKDNQEDSNSSSAFGSSFFSSSYSSSSYGSSSYTSSYSSSFSSMSSYFGAPEKKEEEKKAKETEPEEVVPEITGHMGSINDCALTSDATKLLTVSDDGQGMFWDLHTNKKLLSLYHPDNVPIKSCAVSSDNNMAAITCDNGAVLLYDLRSRTKTMEFAAQGSLVAHRGPATCVAFARNSLKLVTGGWDNVLNLWSPSYRNPTTTLRGASDWINAVDFDPKSDDKLAAGGWDNELSVWTHSSRRSEVFNRVSDVQFSNDGSLLVATNYYGELAVYTNGYSLGFVNRITPHEGKANKVRFGGSYLVTAGQDHSINIRDKETLDLKNEFFCQAPVTALSAKSVNSEVHVVAGDQIGNVYVLKIVKAN